MHVAPWQPPQVWETLQDLILKPQPAAEVTKIQADTLKRLGPKNHTLEVPSSIDDSLFILIVQSYLNVGSPNMWFVPCLGVAFTLKV
jgi:hypothetical protein